MGFKIKESRAQYFCPFANLVKRKYCVCWACWRVQTFEQQAIVKKRQVLLVRLNSSFGKGTAWPFSCFCFYISPYNDTKSSTRNFDVPAR